MRNFVFVLIFVFAITFAKTCAAQDVWIEYRSAENLDIYAMDDTITSSKSNTEKYFKVTSKFVVNGRLQRVVNWTFSQYKSENWRYENDAMDGSHTTVVYNDKLFEFCMEKLGWSYDKISGYYN